MKEKVSFPGLAQKQLKQACDYSQFVLDMGRTLKDRFLTADSTKSHTIQFKVIKDQKESNKNSPMSLSKLSKLMDVLAWTDRADKTL